MAFSLALIALLAHFSSSIRGALIYISDAIGGTNFSTHVSIVEAEEGGLVAILSSRRNHAFAINEATCMLTLPISRGDYNRERLLARSEGSDAGRDSSSQQKWVGPVMLNYRAEAPIFIGPYETKMVTLPITFASFAVADVVEGTEERTSYCYFGGVDQNNSLALGIAPADID